MFGVPLHGHEHPGIRRHGELENHRPYLRPDGFGRLFGHEQIRQWKLGTALRYHDGKFWMYVCTPNEGLFMSTATDPAGPWSPLYQVKNVSGWEDPCPLWDEDGQAYIGRSQLGGGPIIIHKMSADGKTLLDDGRKVYEARQPKVRNCSSKTDITISASVREGGVGTGWQTVMRSKNIYGPYEQKRVLEMARPK